MEDLFEMPPIEERGEAPGKGSNKTDALQDIVRLGQAVAAFLDRSLPEGMSVTKFAVLDHLSASDESRGPAQIARTLGVTKAAMTQTLARLSEAGFVAISEDPRDGRSKLVQISRKGEDMLIACEASLRRPTEEVRASLHSEDWRVFMSAVTQLRATLEEMKTGDDKTEQVG
ncbi:MAG: MarR family transcriptional regulator [Pseudomonadota bacterium]